jgi:hypothetical protein
MSRTCGRVKVVSGRERERDVIHMCDRLDYRMWWLLMCRLQRKTWAIRRIDAFLTLIIQVGSPGSGIFSSSVWLIMLNFD